MFLKNFKVNHKEFGLHKKGDYFDIHDLNYMRKTGLESKHELLKDNRLCNEKDERFYDKVYYANIRGEFWWFVRNDDDFKPLCVTFRSIFS